MENPATPFGHHWTVVSCLDIQQIIEAPERSKSPLITIHSGCYTQHAKLPFLEDCDRRKPRRTVDLRISQPGVFDLPVSCLTTKLDDIFINLA